MSLRKLFQTRTANFVNLHVDKATKKNQALNNSDLITHFTKQTLNLDHLLLTLNVTAQLLNYPKQKSPFVFQILNSRSMVGDRAFWFTFNLAVDFRPKTEVALEILSDQMHTLPRNSALLR